MSLLGFGQPPTGVFQMAYVELIEMDATTDTTFTRFYAASLAWDGSEPVRPFA
jgi:hypothetical protein